MIRGERDFHWLRARETRVFQNRLKCGLGGHHVFAGPEERHIDCAKNFRRAATQSDILASHSVLLRKSVKQLRIRREGIARGDSPARGEGLEGFGRRAVGVFVETESYGRFQSRLRASRIRLSGMNRWCQARGGPGNRKRFADSARKIATREERAEHVTLLGMKSSG